MKNLHKKAVAAVLLMSSMAAVSTTVHAEEASVDEVLAQVVFNQGKRVMNDLSAQLQKHIKQELSQFSINYSSSWSTSEDEVLVSKSEEADKTKTVQKSSDE